MPARQEISLLNAYRNSCYMCGAQAQELPYRLLCTVGGLLYKISALF